MREIVGYEGNTPIYKDMGVARVHGASGISSTKRTRQMMRTVNIVQHLDRVKYPKAYLKKVLNDLH